MATFDPRSGKIVSQSASGAKSVARAISLTLLISKKVAP